MIRHIGLATLVALGLAACGGTSGQDADCVVKVFFELDADRAQVHGLQRTLMADPRVKRVTYVSKQEALAIARKKYPDLVEGLPDNPLPDAIEVTPAERDDAASIVQDLTPNPEGVDAVRDGCIRER